MAQPRWRIPSDDNAWVRHADLIVKDFSIRNQRRLPGDLKEEEKGIDEKNRFLTVTLQKYRHNTLQMDTSGIWRCSFPSKQTLIFKGKSVRNLIFNFSEAHSNSCNHWKIYYFALPVKYECTMPFKIPWDAQMHSKSTIKTVSTTVTYFHRVYYLAGSTISGRVKTNCTSCFHNFQKDVTTLAPVRKQIFLRSSYDEIYRFSLLFLINILHW